MRTEDLEPKRKSWKVKVVEVVFAVVLVVVVPAFALPPLFKGDPPSPKPAICDDATPASELTTGDLGERVETKGVVEEATKLDSGVFLNLGGPNKSQDLTVVIWERNLGNWRQAPDALYEGREIAISGDLYPYKKTPQIEADAQGDITICD